MLSGGPLPGRRPIDRSWERRIVVAGILVAAGYLIAALASSGLPPAARHGIWLPLHLALAGGASTAIAAVMPFFVAAFAAVPPADPRLRAVALALVAGGALLVVAGVGADAPALAASGGLAYVAGIAATGLATVRPVGGSLGPSRGLVTRAYVVALVSVATGAMLATLLLAGWTPVAGAWAAVRPAHAWLNLVGFVSLVIATTLLHFFPTVVGARITASRSARGAIWGVGAGALVAAAGTLAGWGPAALVGAVAVLGGALSLLAMARATWQGRAGWTGDRGWHRFAMGALWSGIGWFCAGTGLAAWREAQALAIGAAPGAAWSTVAVAGPLVAGWLGITFLGSATHLLPAVGPGTPQAHAAQRRLLGRAAEARLAALDVGCMGLAVGLPLGLDDVARAGVALVLAGTLATAALLVLAVRLGLRRPA